MVYNPDESKDGKMAHEGGSWAMHNDNLFDESGAKRERSPSEDINVRTLGDRALRSASERRADSAADDFLRDNGFDPDNL